MPTHGGNSIINGGEMTAVGCPQQKAANSPDSVEQWKADTFAAGLGFNYPEKIQVLADNMLNNYNWLVNEIGVKFRPIITQDGGHRYPRSVISEEGSGAGFVNAELAKCKELGAQLRTRNYVERIIRDPETGRVLGLQVRKGYRFPNPQSGTVPGAAPLTRAWATCGSSLRHVPLLTASGLTSTPENVSSMN